MPFIIGAPRSGTTLLRFMIDSHHSVAIPPETGFLAVEELSNGPISRKTFLRLATSYPKGAPNWPDFGLDAGEFYAELQSIEPFDIGEGARAFYRLYAGKQGKIRYGDKTPDYCKSIELIEQVLPEAFFLHIIRDGRDVATSLRQMWFAPGQDMKTLASYWRHMVESARAAGRRAGGYLEVRFEDLVLDPRSQLELICSRLDLDFDPDMLCYWRRTPERLKEHATRLAADGTVIVTHEQRLMQQALTMQPLNPERISSAKNETTPSEREEFHECAGDLLDELGYEV